jgi:hypothetical protein
MPAGIFRLFCVLGLLVAVEAPTAYAATRTGNVHLGFSGATLSISTNVPSYKTWLEHRQLTLIEPDGKRRVMMLKDASPKLGNQGLNLYHRKQNDFAFVLVGDTECVEIDPIRAILKRCAATPSCQSSSTSAEYLGRFDWMNGYNPPHGEFTYDFRFLPSYDAAPAGSCF